MTTNAILRNYKTDVLACVATGEGFAESFDCRTTEDTPDTGSTEARHQTGPSGRGWALRIKHKSNVNISFA